MIKASISPFFISFFTASFIFLSLKDSTFVISHLLPCGKFSKSASFSVLLLTDHLPFLFCLLPNTKDSSPKCFLISSCQLYFNEATQGMIKHLLICPNSIRFFIVNNEIIVLCVGIKSSVIYR